MTFMKGIRNMFELLLLGLFIGGFVWGWFDPIA